MYQQLAEGPVERDHGAAGISGGRWDAAPDLERFLSSFYRYFEVKGYRGVLAVHLSHLVALAFTIGFSFVLLFFVNWKALLSCDSEESCRAVLLCYAEPFHHVGLWRSVVLLSFCLFSIYWIFNLVAAYQNVRDAAEISSYYKDRLGIISDEILATMSWAEVVSRLIEQQKASPFCIVQDELTALEVANIIMREDNFMIAFTNHHTFTARLPSWMPARLVHTRSVLWNLRAAVFNYIFDSRSRIRGDFLDRPGALAQRLRWMGLVNLLFVVPVLIFVTIYFFMRHAEEFRSHRASPFQRQWTDFARWTFREFNELPHQFKARMTKAQHMAEAYVRSTKAPSPVLESLQRCVKYIAGSILAVLLVVALWDETPLLFVKIQDKNLLWYLAFFGFLFAIADSTEDVPEQHAGLPAAPRPSSSRPSSRRGPHTLSTPLHMHCAMMRLVKCIHYLPPSWRDPAPLAAMVGGYGSCTRRAKLWQHFAQIREELLHNFFVHRIQVLFEELLGVILTPLLLIVYLPRAAADIVEVVSLTRHSSPNLGDWCGFGCLDPAQNGSEFYGGPPLQHGGSVGPLEMETGQRSLPGTLVSNGGKLEKSVVSFVLAHRLSWPFCEGGDLEDGGFQSLAGSRRETLGSLGGSRLLKPSLGQEMRRGLERLAPVISQSVDSGLRTIDQAFDQFAASSSAGAHGLGASQREYRAPLLPKMSQSASHSAAEIPLMEFSRMPAGADEAASEGGLGLRPPASVSWSGPAASGEAMSNLLFTELVPDVDDDSLDVGHSTASGSHPPQAFESFSMATERGSPSEAGLSNSMIDPALWKAWGYPASALRLMYNLEEFQQRELAPGAPHVDVYALLPDEFLRADRATSPLDGNPCPASPATDWSDETDQGSCSSHFFWLEVLYDYHSGRHPSHQGDGGGEMVTFERLDMDSPTSLRRGPAG